MSKLWGGVFAEATSDFVLEFTSSLQVDQRLWATDIRASIAHAEMLGLQGIIPEVDSKKIIEGLIRVSIRIQSSIKNGESPWEPLAEDVHSEIERLLKNEIGELAGKLHTARSRNDQVVTVFKMYCHERLQELSQNIHALKSTLFKIAKEKSDWIMPGLTHTQHAQPVSLSHHLLAYFWMFDRDERKIKSVQEWMMLESPLGSAALAGTSFPIDREFTAKKLGFLSGGQNSMDGVSDRDFALDILHLSTLSMLHLSRISEELILWSTPEFGFLRMSDKVTTGSSIMPQKRNPDVAELIRGRVGRVQSAWVGLSTTLKALPLSYNRDLQEDKEYVFSALDTVTQSVKACTLMLENCEFNREAMESVLAGDGSNATDFADVLVTYGVPFREAHEVSGRVIKTAAELGRPLEALTYQELVKIEPRIPKQIISVLKHKAVLERRTSYGGTAPSQVALQLERAGKILLNPVSVKT